MGALSSPVPSGHARHLRHCPTPRRCGSQEKGGYRKAYCELQDAKAEVDGLQAALGRARARLQRDFQAWFAAMQRSAGSSLGTTQQGEQGQEQEQEGGQTSAEKAGDGLWEEQEQQGWLIPAVSSAAVRPQNAAASSAAALPSFSSWKTAPSFVFDPQAAHTGHAGSSSAPSPRVPYAQWPQAALQSAGPPQGRGQQAAEQVHQQGGGNVPPYDPYAGVETAVLEAARPLLTSIPEADADILRFYQARHGLLRSLH